jgi:hypothetical protein
LIDKGIQSFFGWEITANYKLAFNYFNQHIGLYEKEERIDVPIAQNFIGYLYYLGWKFFKFNF